MKILIAFKKKSYAHFFNIYKKFFSRFFRFSSYPFISGDTFRNNCKFIYDEFKSFNPNLVKSGDFVFVKTDMLSEFFSSIHKNINNSYYLLSHNSDHSINSQYSKYLDKKIILWYAQNIEERFSEKIQFIPIGLENKWYFKNGNVYRFKKILKNPPSKNILINASFSQNTHISRKDMYSKLSNIDIVLFNSRQKNKDYLTTIASSYFNICPRGNGIDTHRIWESLIFKTIPIVEKNNFTELLLENDIPVLIIKDWSELKNFTKLDILTMYKDITKNFKIENFSNFSYWYKKINFK